MNDMSPVRRPIVRWHGGKWMLAPWIISCFPDHKVYVEPFGGGGSVLIRKARSYAEVYNDLDGKIVEVFRVVRDFGEELRRRLHATPFSRVEFDLSYEVSADPIEQARRTIFRTFAGFGTNAHERVTGFRANSNRAGTTPAHDWANYSDVMEFLVERLRGVVIEQKDALAVMAQHDGGEVLHYCDPPYLIGTRSDRKKDYAHEMSDEDHARLLTFLRGLKGFVVLSGYRNDIYDDMLQGWQRLEKKTYADGAKKRTECLWINTAAVEKKKASLI